LAATFSINRSSLLNPHNSENLVYREFVSCVKSIKILSSVEVQQMSLDGDLGGIPSQTQACSASDDANAWRG
jgi:hypothetical protein